MSDRMSGNRNDLAGVVPSCIDRERPPEISFSLAVTGLMCQSTFLCEEQYHAHLARWTMSQLR